MTIKSVFLSYGRKDDEAFVREMWQYLTNNGIKAWFDREDLPSRGESFQKELADAVDNGVEQVDRLILFLGAHSADSVWCEREWKHALKNCIPVMVVLVQHTFDAKSAPDGSPTTQLPDDIKKKFPADLFDVNGLEFPPNMRQNAGEKLYNLLTNAENLPLAELRGVPTLQIYMDRPEYITAIKQQMRLNDPTDITDFRTGIVAITSKQATTGVNGIAGIGKTTIASALAQDCNIRRNFQHIIWIRVGNEMRRPDALAFLRAIADQLNPHEEQFKDQYLQEQTAKIRVETLLSDKRVLLILDDVWDRDLLDVFLFNAKGYKLVTTTRNRRLMNENMVEIERLTNEDGVRLMTYYLNPEKPESVKVDEIPELAQIVTTLHGHTLAIKVIATLLKEQGVQDAPAYLQRLQNLENANLFSFLREDEDLDGETARNRDVEKSLTLSYDHLKPDHQKYFRATGIFAPNVGYTIEALSSIWEIPDPLLAKQMAKSLQNVGLLDYDETRNRYNQHPLLRAYALKLLTDANENEAVFGRYADFYTKRAKEIFVDLQDKPELWADKEGGANFDDVVNIKALGAELMRQTQNGTTGDLGPALEFARVTRRYVTNRMEEKVWSWLEIGLNAVRALRRENADDADLLDKESLMLSELGTIKQNLGHPQDALCYYEQSLILRAGGNRGVDVTALTNIGMMYSVLGDKHKALAYFEQALPLLRAGGYHSGEATTLNNIGGVYDDLGEHQRALAYYEQSLPISRAIGNRGGEAKTLTNIGLVYSALGDKHKALAYYEQSLPIGRAVGDKDGEARTLNNIGLVYYDLGESQKALAYYEQSLLISRAIGNRSVEAKTLTNIGVVYFALGEKQDALAYFERALPIHCAVGDRGGEATTLNNIGSIYSALGEKQDALAYFEQALLIHRAVGNRRGEATTLNNIGGVYDDLGEKQKVLAYLEQALSILEEIGDLYGAFVVASNISTTYYKMNDLDKAIAHAEKTVAIGTKINHPDLQEYKNYLENVKQKRGDRDVPPEEPDDEFDAITAKLVDIYRQAGEKGLREMLKQSNVPDAQIDAFITAFIAKLADIYRQAGEDGLREMLQQSNVPDAQIDEIITVVIAQVAGGGGDDTDDESADMLPFETIQQWVQNTYAVMKHVPNQLLEWRDQLDGAKSRMAGMGDDYQNEVQFVDALLAVLRGEKPSLPESHPYHEPVRQLLNALG